MLDISERHLTDVRREVETFPPPVLLGTLPRWSPAVIRRWMDGAGVACCTCGNDVPFPAPASRSRPRRRPRGCSVSTDPKTKRRDADPVRVYDDGRIAYWTGGRPGLGEREFERCGNRAAAEVRATKLRTRLARAHGLGPRAASVLDQAMQDMLAAMRTAGEPEGSIRQYKSNWNTWVPADIGGKVRCLDVDIRHWASIFDNANAEKASRAHRAEHRTDPRRAHGMGGRPWLLRIVRAVWRSPSSQEDRQEGAQARPDRQGRERRSGHLFEHLPQGHGHREVRRSVRGGLPRLRAASGTSRLRYRTPDQRAAGPSVRLRSTSRPGRSTSTGSWTATRRGRRVGRPRAARPGWPCSGPATTTSPPASSRTRSPLTRTTRHHGWLFPRHRSVTAWADRGRQARRRGQEGLRLGLDLPLAATRLRHLLHGIEEVGRVQARPRVCPGVARPRAPEHHPGHVRRAAVRRRQGGPEAHLSTARQDSRLTRGHPPGTSRCAPSQAPRGAGTPLARCGPGRRRCRSPGHGPGRTCGWSSWCGWWTRRSRCRPAAARPRSAGPTPPDCPT